MKIKMATLWVQVNFRSSLPWHFRRSLPDRNLTLWVFRINRQLPANATRLHDKEFAESTEMSASLPTKLSTLGWQKFDLTATVRQWYESRSSLKERLRLLVDCSGCNEHVEAKLFPKLPPLGSMSSTAHHFGRGRPNSSPQLNYSSETQPPFLVIHTDPSVTKRVRRRALDCVGSEPTQCCKQRLFISFKKLGWEDWIIAPHGYHANYCRGDCGGMHRTPDTFLNYYTHVIEEFRKMNPLSGMQPCCAPLKFSSMSLVYFGPDSNIIKRDLPKMVVDECGCP
ncbi:inhibin beta chain [Bacillus rossius redtenbacheri]|uniref:inhibin beta chain n=1 Tax=Bacillus rossius redtenbacheri TaxID=93214 RepID=UPI002FDDB009